MAKEQRPDMSCARVKQHKSSDIGAAERHNERKNESYDNINVVTERIPLNVHFRDPGGKSYMEILREMEGDGAISLRGLRQDATLFDEIIIDVNTMYFERKGGYDYSQLTSLAKEGITSRNEIHNLRENARYYRQQYSKASSALEKAQERYDALKEKCQPFLDAMEHFPDLVRAFVSKVRELFSVKEAQERREKEEAERRRQAEREARKQKNRSKGWER